MDKRQPALGRFSEPALLILSCLQSSPKNGQAIREEQAEALSDPPPQTVHLLAADVPD